ncbi:hypothetical protein B0F90DRAFT_1778939 [Multifurca ochricompacta]|uniref:Uncharacterized protein n=1 Tax=Multifurca ochricompacta TaxID=376703 RepID=A0AAD4QJ50_9AGAM|nr:hypothetical protein B0F90DRAFT_1778939 [Multifurca ochricompacta]
MRTCDSICSVPVLVRYHMVYLIAILTDPDVGDVTSCIVIMMSDACHLGHSITLLLSLFQYILPLSMSRHHMFISAEI